ncbi:MAG: hypothetical protein R2705_17490 [Ilumatobacteraceae bacterium]
MNATTHPRPITTNHGSTTVRNVLAAIRSERIKLSSVRATAIFLGLTTVVGVTMSLILGKVVVTDPYDHLPFTIGNTFLVSSWLTTLFVVVAAPCCSPPRQHGTSPKPSRLARL